MAAPLWQRFAAACVLGLGVCLASSAQEKPEKKFPSASEVAELLKKEPITLDNWMLWRGRLLEWISDRGKGTDSAFDAARKFVRSQVNDKDELNAALVKDNLAWYLLSGAYAEESENKLPAEQLKAANRAEKAVRQSIQLDDRFPQAHRNLARYLLIQEEMEPSDEKDIARLPRLPEAVRELNEAVRLDPKTPVAEVRGLYGKLAYQRRRYGTAETQLLKAVEEDPEYGSQILPLTALAMLRGPRLDSYPKVVAALEELQQKYPNNQAPTFMIGLAYIYEGNTPQAREAFARGLQRGGNPSKLVPIGEVHETAMDDINHKSRSWPHAASLLNVLALYFSEDGTLAVLHAFALYQADEYQMASDELARARRLGTKPEAILEQFAPRQGAALAEQIPYQAVRHALMGPFLWTVGAIGALYGLSLIFMSSLAPTPERKQPGAATAPVKGKRWATPGDLALALVLCVLSFLVSWVIAKFFTIGLFFPLVSMLIVVGIVSAARPYFKQRSKEEPVGPEEPPVLTGLYAMTMLGGIGLFYAAILFLLVGLAVLICGLIVLLLKLFSFSVLFILLIVGVLAWVFSTMLLAPPAKEKRGIVVNAADIARLRQAVDEAARKLEADPIKVIRLTTGSAVSLAMIGRGPLGLLGGSRPVLVIGYTALRLLNTAELQALIAQQLAPLSRREDGWGRVIYSSWLTMSDTLDDWRRSGGIRGIGLMPISGDLIRVSVEVGYGGINPFYNVLIGYFWVFNQLAGPFIRGRIAQADQAAAKLYGGAVLESALLKVNADGPLVDSRFDELVKQLLVEAPDLSNMYAAWDELCADATTPPQQGSDVQPAAALRELNFALLAVGPRERNQARRRALGFKGPTPHGLPTLAQRIGALPGRTKFDKGKKEAGTEITTGDSIRKDSAKPPATELLDNVEGIEEQLTEFSIPPLARSKAHGVRRKVRKPPVSETR